MFIKENDFRYLEGLYKGLDKERRKKFLNILLKAGARGPGRRTSRGSRWWTTGYSTCGRLNPGSS
jgi:hypothetical protein